MFRKFLILVLFFTGLKVCAQTNITFRYADSLTYSLYSESSWTALISAGRDAIKSGHDYYYMRMRLGIAYFERGNYSMAIHHFRKALEFNTNDQTALEYLFYSFYYFGSNNSAMALLPEFSSSIRDRIMEESKIKKNKITLESFYSVAGTDMIVSDPQLYFSDPEQGSQIVTKHYINNAVYAHHNLGKHVVYYHSFTNLLKENFLHYYDGTKTANLPDQRVVQNQYYGSFIFTFNNGWEVSPSFHFLGTSYPVIGVVTSGMNSTFKTFNFKAKGYFTGLSFKKNLRYVAIGLESGFYDINTGKRFQGTLSLMVYPLGNTSLYFGGKLAVSNWVELAGQEPFVVNEFVSGFSVANKIWFEFSALTGDLNNYVGSNGLYIYNGADILKNKLLARLIIPFNKAGFAVFAGGGISSQFSEFIAEDGLLSEGSNTLNYKSNNLTGGISWNF